MIWRTGVARLCPLPLPTLPRMRGRVGRGEVGQRGQRRTTVRANATLCVMRLCPPYKIAFHPERALVDAAPNIAAGDRGLETTRRRRSTIEQDRQLVGDAKIG